MKIQRIHHVAYRRKDARETATSYRSIEYVSYLLTIAGIQVPSTREPDPYMHIFLDAGNGNILVFFELPTKPPMGRDSNTPAWTQHIAFEVESIDALLETKAKLEADGIEVVGPTDHTIFKSIYFFDPSGHRVELVANTGTPKMARMLDEVKWEMLNEWALTKKAPQQARWMHDGSYAGE